MEQEERKEQRALSTVPTATIKIDKLWSYPERHGAMFDLAASEDVELQKGETKVIPLGIRVKLPEGYFGLVVPRSSTCLRYGIMMANSVGIIEPDYCGPNDVWGFVAYAVRDTKIPKGMRIAQFMPVRMFGDLDFDVVDEMPYPDRGGYGSTGERSNGGELSFYDRRGRKLTVGCYCRINGTDSCGIVKKLYESEERGSIVLADFSGYGEMRKRCVDVELDDRPRDYDGVPIEVGDVLYVVDDGGSEPAHWFEPLTVVGTSENGGFAGNREPTYWRIASNYTHREPDSFEKIAADSFMFSLTYCKKRGLGLDLDISNMRDDLISRMKAVAARG